MKRTSNDYAKEFQLLTGKVRESIYDLMENENHISTLEIDEENRVAHEIGYYSTCNGWQGEGIAKIETAPNGSLTLTNEYGEELFEDGIAESEWVVILEMVEKQIEKDYKPRYYPVFNGYNPTERHCFGYGDITYIDECESFPTLMDAKREVLSRMMAETNHLVDLPVHTIYERTGNTYKEVSTAIASHHCYLLGIEPPVVTDDLIKQGMTNVYIHTL